MDREEAILNKLYTENEYGFKYQDLDAKLDSEDVEYLVENFGIATTRKDPATGATQRIHNMCINCQARQVLKYKGTTDPRGNAIDSFTVRCNYVPGELPPGSREMLHRFVTEKNMDRGRALKILKSTVDPVSWCELMFGFDDSDTDWRIRPYQKEQLRCSSLRYVIREGRRSGKTFAMALKLLYLAFNLLKRKGRDAEGNVVERGPEIIIITPYQAQVANIFNEMEKILKRNKDLVNEVTTAKGGNLYVKTPYYRLELENGATVSGFVSGVGVKEDGSGGGTMRGQNADVIYLDEMDMIPEEILLKVIQPLLLTNSDVMMIATSTPIGKRGKFYEWCNERADFKEDYLPSTVLPQWDIIKYEVEAENTEEGFQSEFMAHFIEGAYGVFKPSYIYRARGAFTYEDCDIRSSWWQTTAGVKERSELVKVMGIDWNKNAGTEFVVVAYDPNQHHWFVVEATNISSSEYSSVAWKQEVIRLNYKWKPDYIYADEGYGHVIIEDLKVHAHSLRINMNDKGFPATREDHETVKLLDRLKAFNFSQKVTLKSPIDYTDIVKTGKEFLVENAVRVFEEGRIWFPEDDKVLLDQLLHYVVLRRHASNNKPIYGPDLDRIGDHRLDALMLALGGLFLERSMYASGNMATSAPVSLTKKFLDKRASKLDVGRVTGADVLNSLGKTGAGINAKVLEIHRGSTPEEHQRVNTILEANQMVSKSSWFNKRQPRKSRGQLGRGPDPSSVYETMMARAESSRGYSNDTENVYKAREIHSQPSIVKPRSRPSTRRRRRGLGRRRR